MFIITINFTKLIAKFSVLCECVVNEVANEFQKKGKNNDDIILKIVRIRILNDDERTNKQLFNEKPVPNRNHNGK